MNLTVLNSFSYAGLMYQPQIEYHDPDPPLILGEVETTDYETVYLNLQCLVEEEYPVVYLDLQAISTFEEHTTFDAATVYLDLQALGGECYSTASANNFGEGEATLRWTGLDVLRWSGTEYIRWSGRVSVGDVLAC